MKQKETQYRQGDVLLIEVDKFPEEATYHGEPQTVLALGEVQGHSHRLEVGAGRLKTCDLPGGLVGVEVIDAPLAFVHGTPGVETVDAHKPLTIAPGRFVRIMQHEWDPQFERVQVVD